MAEEQGMGSVDDRSVGAIVGDLAGTAKELYRRVDIGREIQEHPYRTLAIAAGVGYLLGGGLFTSTTAAVLRVGARMAMLPVFQQALVTAASGGQERTTDESLYGL